jgi:hypothetical protein
VEMGGLENGSASYSLTRCRHMTPSRWSPPLSAQRREKERGKRARGEGGRRGGKRWWQRQASSDFAGTGSGWKVVVAASIARIGWMMDWESLADIFPSPLFSLFFPISFLLLVRPLCVHKTQSGRTLPQTMRKRDLRARAALSYCWSLFSCYGNKMFSPFKLRLNMCRPV